MNSMTFALMVVYLELWNKTKGKRVEGKICFINDKAILNNPNGSTVIIPADGSFFRVINKTWYD